MAIGETTYVNKHDTRVMIDEVVRAAKEATCSTLTPDGSYGILNNAGEPKVSKDGSSVIQAFMLNDTNKDLIVSIIREASVKTDREVGDGTTTTIFMMAEFYEHFKNDFTFRKERFLNQMVEDIERRIGDMILKVDVNDPRFKQMLLTTANNESEIVDLILDLHKRFANPNITIRPMPNLPHDTVEHSSEIVFEGSVSKDFYTPTIMTANSSTGVTPSISKMVLVDNNIGSIDNSVLKSIIDNSGNSPVYIIGRSWNPNAIAQLDTINNKLGVAKLIPYQITAPGSLGTNTFSDIAKLLGGNTLTDINDFDLINLFIVDVPYRLLPNGMEIISSDPKVKERAKEILDYIKPRFAKLSLVDRQSPIGRHMHARIGRLEANNITINVTGLLLSEANERYARFVDVKKAAETGLQFGILPGIGYAYLEVAKQLHAELKEDQDKYAPHRDLVVDLINVLKAQYEHITDEFAKLEGDNVFVDLVTYKESTIPDTVYDNAGATITALKAGWSTAKTLIKVSVITGSVTKRLPSQIM